MKLRVRKVMHAEGRDFVGSAVRTAW
jgi:hypothetical protein